MIPTNIIHEISDKLLDAILVFNYQQKIIYFNAKLLQITNSKKEEIENKVIQSLYSKLKLSGAFKVFGNALKENSNQCEIVKLGEKNYQLSTFAISNAILCIFHDVSAKIENQKTLKKQEEQLHYSENYNNNLLDSSMDMIIAVDSNRKIITFNKAAQQTFGYTPEEILGKHVKILYNSHQEGLETHKAVVKHGKTIREVTNIRKNGETFICNLATSQILDDKGHRLGIMGISRDISKQKKQAEEFIQLKSRLQKEKIDLKSLGNSLAIQKVIKQLELVAPTNMTVIMQGESGTGKELFSKLLCDNSTRKEHKYLAVDCGAIPESLIESELFGHEKGAFTGADNRKLGMFERAHGGTLLLDEITNLNPSAQTRLLRVLQERTFTRIGGSKVIKFDVRIIAASNIEIKEAVKQGDFRLDLFHRLNEFMIQLPPLSQRLDDIPVLADKFLRSAAAELGKKFTGLSADALKKLLDYSWPGNVREFRNILRRATLICDQPLIDSEHIVIDEVLPSSHRTILQQLQHGSTMKDITTSHLEEIELQLLEYALEQAKGNKSKAAEILGMKRVSLYSKLKLYNLM